MKSLLPLILGLVIFIGGHVVTRLGGTRDRLIGAFGLNVYRGLYSLMALMGLALIVHGFASYRAGGMIALWDPPRFMWHIASLLVWIAFILLAATYLPGKIKAKAKHPMLLAVKIWASAHLLVNGDLGSILLFGSLLGWAVFTRIMIKRSARGEAIPGAEIVVAGRWNDLVAIAIGTAATIAFLYGLHRWLIGVDVLVLSR